MLVVISPWRRLPDGAVGAPRRGGHLHAPAARVLWAWFMQSRPARLSQNRRWYGLSALLNLCAQFLGLRPRLI